MKNMKKLIVALMTCVALIATTTMVFAEPKGTVSANELGKATSCDGGINTSAQQDGVGQIDSPARHFRVYFPEDLAACQPFGGSSGE